MVYCNRFDLAGGFKAVSAVFLCLQRFYGYNKENGCIEGVFAVMPNFIKHFML